MEGLDVEAMAKDARKALKTIGLQIEDYVKVAGLPVGYMQFIEIAREIDKTGIRLLVFDEPTAVLTESEADRLLEAMRVIASRHCHYFHHPSPGRGHGSGRWDDHSPGW